MNRLSEKMFRALDKALEGKSFKDDAELNAFMAQFAGRNIDELAEELGQNDQDRAMDLVEAAEEAESVEEASGLLRQALALDPTCCDALVGLAHLESRTRQELLQCLEGAIASEKARLGEACFKENKGHFWGFHETRPYMRACLDRAMLLQGMGDLAAAQKAYRDLILLNKNDNQGVRLLLGPLCLQRGDLKAYRALRNKFKRTEDLELLWCDVLESFLLGFQQDALAAFQAAVDHNGHLKAYLLRHRSLPRTRPAGYTWGSREHAVSAAFNLVPAWQVHPAALAWLKGLR